MRRSSSLDQLDQTDMLIVRMLHQGLGDAAIGRRLGIGHRTVQRRVRQLMERWNVPGRVALGARAQELGLFGSEQDDVRAVMSGRFAQSA